MSKGSSMMVSTCRVPQQEREDEQVGSIRAHEHLFARRWPYGAVPPFRGDPYSLTMRRTEGPRTPVLAIQSQPS